MCYGPCSLHRFALYIINMFYLYLILLKTFILEVKVLYSIFILIQHSVFAYMFIFTNKLYFLILLCCYFSILLNFLISGTADLVVMNSLSCCLSWEVFLLNSQRTVFLGIILIGRIFSFTTLNILFLSLMALKVLLKNSHW